MGASHQGSIVKQVIDRLESKMAIGESRRAAKQAIRAQQQGSRWSVSDGKIHSYKTRSNYQEHAIRFAKWARETYGIKTLAQLDAQAVVLVSEYLRLHIAQHKSPSTLHTERSALRLLFDNRSLAQEVPLPRRTRETIHRSRGPAAHDRHFQPANWQPLLRFLHATGLRKSEVSVLRCRNIVREQDGSVWVHVESGKGGRMRDVPVLAGYEAEVWALKETHMDEEKAFDRIPVHLDVHSYRREYAQALYLQYAPDWSLPPKEGRLRRRDYHLDAAQRVSWALGHSRIDVVLRHYLR